MCDCIHHSRDTPETTSAIPSRCSIGPRGLPRLFLFIITQVLSVHMLSCQLAPFPADLFMHNLKYELQLMSRGLRIAPQERWRLEIVPVQWKPRWSFKKLVALSQLNAVTENINKMKNSRCFHCSSILSEQEPDSTTAKCVINIVHLQRTTEGPRSKRHSVMNTCGTYCIIRLI